MLEKVVVYISSAGTLLAFPGLFLYCIFEAQQNEKPRLWSQIGALLALGVYSLVFCWFSAAVRSIAPFELINRERRFFWDFFIKELEKNDSFSAAAQAMNFHLPEVEKFIQELSDGIGEYPIALKLLSQLNRDKSRGNNRLTVNDLKGSSAIEQEADYIAFLQQTEKTEADVFGIDFYAVKTRSGASRWNKKIVFDKNIGKMSRILGKYEQL